MIIFPQCLIRLPCRMWNVDKWTPEEYESRMADAEAMFDCSLDLCEDQHARGRGCVLEHPTPASSWKRDKARRVMAIPGFRRTNFDQCATGLVSPSNEPMKKRTSPFVKHGFNSWSVFPTSMHLHSAPSHNSGVRSGATFVNVCTTLP